MADTNELKRQLRAEPLTWYYNGHQRQLVAAQIVLSVLATRKPNEVYGVELVPAPGMPANQQQFARVKVRVKDEITKQARNFNVNLEMLIAIEDLLAEENSDFERLYSTKKYAPIEAEGAEKEVAEE